MNDAIDTDMKGVDLHEIEDSEDSEDGDDTSDDEIPLLVNLDHIASPTSPPSPTSPTQPLPLPLIEVPVTILTGFLGAGKTTLIQHILQDPHHGKKIAVIENEFGGNGNNSGNKGLTEGLAEKEGLAIETLIARDGSTNENLTDMIELPNGCICCTVKDDLVSTLESLLEKTNNSGSSSGSGSGSSGNSGGGSGSRRLDYIIIECSGMANPGPIASIFWLDHESSTSTRTSTFDPQSQLRL